MPPFIEKYHQLKNELLALSSCSSSSSNWSAPKAWTQGLWPPWANATKYKETKKKKRTSSEGGEQTTLLASVLQLDEWNAGERDKNPRPCHPSQFKTEHEYYAWITWNKLNFHLMLLFSFESKLHLLLSPHKLAHTGYEQEHQAKPFTWLFKQRN